ncbi:pilus assembly protein TadG-related protein [Paenibacillus sp.]|uniref:pilus assembly protein TadG-related protein n=1 Tax=Paenibacillus sp. TaxID=58172 RepID=UPI002D705CD6|nr:pilus assembly protein TadG-related protein [Paenibacillus sp.]HZG58585.1 pilus assembly protein TadG-related protein [Paenibacillus sp.]
MERNDGWRQRLPALARDERGNVIALVSLSMVALLAFAGLVIDGGLLMATRAQMQKAANAAALSAAQELTTSEAAVEAVAETVLHRHGEHAHMDRLEVSMQDRVYVGLTAEVPLGFAGIFGFDAAPVSVAAIAELGRMGSAIGAAPLGIDESIPLAYGVEYRLKVDNTMSETGYFGVLALGGPGAATYEDNLRYGYQGWLGLNDVLETQTGNIAGKTRSSIAERLTNCPYPEGEMFHRDCPRILLVPVYRPHSYESKQLKAVEITGFAYFYVTKPMDPHDTYITGKFIQRAGTGFARQEAADKGAFAIRLTE